MDTSSPLYTLDVILMTDISSIKSAVPMELDKLDDLVRWLVSSSQGQQGTIFFFKLNQKNYYATLIILPGYFEFRGLPLLIYVSHPDPPSSHFIRFDIRKESADHALSFQNGFDERDSNLGYIQYIPVVVLKSVPPIFNFKS